MFSNTQVNLSAIPKREDLEFRSISKNYLKLLILQRLIVFFFLFILSVCSAKFLGNTKLWPWLLIPIGFLGISWLLGFVIMFVGFKKRLYAIREKDITYSKGVLVHQTTTVPFSRIQHLELKQSFLAKKFNVATLNIFTAGESGGDLNIQGLSTEEATRINDFLTKKINGAD